MRIPTDVYKKVVAAKVYMDESYHRKICLDEIAQRACISKFHFHRLFARIYQITPHRYITNRRIHRAMELLSCPDMTVTQASIAVGFDSLGSFSLLFKKQISLSPAQYRLQVLARNAQIQNQPSMFIPHCHMENRSAL